MCGVQSAVVNLDATDRFAEEEILLPALARAKVYKKHGMACVLCGVDATGIQHNEPNYASDLRRLDVEGRWFDMPDDVNGGTRRMRLRVWDLLFSGDMLGCGSVLPFCETTGAHKLCRACDFDSSAPDAYRPISFLRRSNQAKRQREQVPKLRD